MKTKKYIYSKLALALSLFMVMASCERDLSEDAVVAGFSTDPDVFIDAFSAGLDYAPFSGSFQEAFSVDTDEVYEGNASMRFDIPAFGQGFGGANFPTTVPRDLSGYDALTFWAKGLTPGDINEIGFGIDPSNGNRLQATVRNMNITTQWRKYTIPLPNPELLTEVTGLFWYAEGAVNAADNVVNTFWIDEMKFEKTGTVAQPRPSINNGNTTTTTAFIGTNAVVTNLSQTLNTGSGEDVTVFTGPGYFNFTSSNTSVATVNEFGQVNVIGQGTTVITGSLNGIAAEGSLIIESQGVYQAAPAPTVDASSVISLFSDNYTNAPVDFYNGFYQPFQTTTSNDFSVNGDNVLNYENFNFVGIEFNQNVPTINGKLATNLRFDVFVPEGLPAAPGLTVAVVDFGGDASFGGGDDTSISQDFTTGFAEGQWFTIDMDITSLSPKTNLGQIILSGDGPGDPPSNFYVDNMFFYNANGDDITPANVSLPLDFEIENKANYAFVGFEGADSAIETNPDQTGVNTSETVMRTTKTVGAQFFAGTFVDLDTPIDFSQTQTLTVKVWSPKANIPIRMALERNDGTAAQVAIDVNTTVANQWEELTFDFSGVFNSSADYNRIVMFMEFVPNLPGDGSTYYFDDIRLAN